jgi:hypothetical protein
MIMLKLKAVILPALDVADNVNIAETDWLGVKTVLPRFQVTDKYELAFVGTQLPVVMDSVSGREPVFLT